MMKLVYAAVLALAAAPALAEVPAWMQGEWRTNARLTAPDGAQLRIRCTLDASAAGNDWTGVLGCATVQGRFESQWGVAVAGGSASGQVRLDGPDGAETLSVTGPATAEAITLASPDGQSVSFAPGVDGALVVDMQALGPQRLTGALSFEVR